MYLYLSVLLSHLESPLLMEHFLMHSMLHPLSLMCSPVTAYYWGICLIQEQRYVEYPLIQVCFRHFSDFLCFPDTTRFWSGNSRRCSRRMFQVCPCQAYLCGQVCWVLFKDRCAIMPIHVLVLCILLNCCCLIMLSTYLTVVSCLCVGGTLLLMLAYFLNPKKYQMLANMLRASQSKCDQLIDN